MISVAKKRRLIKRCRRKALLDIIKLFKHATYSSLLTAGSSIGLRRLRRHNSLVTYDLHRLNNFYFRKEMARAIAVQHNEDSTNQGVNKLAPPNKLAHHYNETVTFHSMPTKVVDTVFSKVKIPTQSCSSQTTDKGVCKRQDLEYSHQRIIERFPRSWPKSCAKQSARGLSNPQFLCYRRAVLQMLLNIPELLHWYQDHAIRMPCKLHHCVICALKQLSLSYWKQSADRKALDSALFRFDKTISILAGLFGKPEFQSRNVQHDAQEFLSWLLRMLDPKSALEDVLPKRAKKVSLTLNINKDDPDLRKVSIQCQSLFKMNTQWWRTCNHCGAVVPSGNAEDEVPLFVTANQSLELPIAIQKAFHDNVDSIVCEKCGIKASQNRKKRINASPEILMISLKRWKAGARGVFRKSNSAITFPHLLDLSEHWVMRTSPLKYKLSSVVYHSGSMDFGHYIARVISPAGVFEVNDDFVSSSRMEDLLSPSAGGFTPMILTYVKVS